MSILPTQQTSTSGDHARLFTKIQELADFQYQGPANVESACKAVDYDMATCVVSDFQDRNAFPESQFVEETKALHELSEVLAAGQTYVSLLYSYRSCSRALSIQSIHESRLAELHQLSFTVLHPEIQKLVQFMRYTETAISTLRIHFQTIVKAEAKKSVQSDALFDAFVQCVNTLILLDALKNNKASLTNDFSSYKRSFSRLRAALPEAETIAEEIHTLQMFLGNPAHPRDVIMFNLKTSLQSVDAYDLGFCALLDYVRDCLESKRWLLPDEEFGYIRIVPFLLYLLDSDLHGEGAVSKSKKEKEINAFKHKLLNLTFFKKLFKITPVVPLYGDMHITVLFVLRQCHHWDEADMLYDWTTSSPDKLPKHYLLSSYHAEIRAEYNKFTVDFTALLNETKAYQQSHKQITPQMLERVFTTVLGGLKMVAQWSSRVFNQCAWKYANPCSRDEYLKLSGRDSEVSTDKSGVQTSHSQGNADEYEQAVRYNYSSKELYCLIDVLGMIKGIGSAMLENELVITPLINRSIHDDVQIFLQTEVARPLRKAYKNDRKEVKDVLLQIREFGGDWFDFNKQKDDYLLVKKELVQVNRDFPRRPTAPSPTQLNLIRRMMYTVYSSKAPGMKGGLFSEKNLKDEWLPVWNKFYSDSFYYQYLLDYGNTVKTVTDMSFLWFHEFYLEMTGCVQFPITMSMPWILTDYLIKNRNLKDNIFFPFDIYNDAAARALYTLKQQFLYDEIEAELNLAFDQLLFHLSNDIFAYYKTVAGAVMIDKSYKAGFEEAKGSADALSVRHVRYSALMSQTHVTLLGRNVDVTVLVASHCNRLLRENIHTVIRRFESAEFSGVVELASLLRHAKLTHHLLSGYLPMDSFEHIMRESDESVGLCQFSSRILRHAFTELVGDVFVNYVYNDITQRFVRTPYPIPNATEVQRESAPKDVETYMWYGKGHREAFDREMLLYKGFIGAEHISALLEVLGEGQEFMLAREITNDLIAKVIGDTWIYLDTVAKGMIPTKPPSAQYGVIGSYLYFEAKLKAVSSWTQLRTGLFQKLREIGNGLVFLVQLEDTMQVKGHLAFQTQSMFTNIVPVPPRDPSLPPLDEAHQELFIRGNQKLAFVTTVTEVLNSLWDNSARNNYSKLTHQSAYAESKPVAVSDVQTWYHPADLASHVDKNLGNTIQNVIRTANIAADSMLQECVLHNPPSLVTAALARLINACKDSGFTAALGSHDQLAAFSTPKVCDLETGRDLARIIATLQFVFNQHPAKGQPTDKAVFGDGFSWGLCAILHSVGERPRFELLDFSSHVSRIDMVSPCPREVPKVKKGQSTGLQAHEEQIIPFVVYFLEAAIASKDLNGAILDLFDNYCPSPRPDMPHLHPPTKANVPMSVSMSAPSTPATPSSHSVMPTYSSPAPPVAPMPPLAPMPESLDESEDSYNQPMPPSTPSYFNNHQPVPPSEPMPENDYYEDMYQPPPPAAPKPPVPVQNDDYYENMHQPPPPAAPKPPVPVQNDDYYENMHQPPPPAAPKPPTSYDFDNTNHLPPPPKPPVSTPAPAESYYENLNQPPPPAAPPKAPPPPRRPTLIPGSAHGMPPPPAPLSPTSVYGLPPPPE